MPDVQTVPTYAVHRTVAGAPILPDAADPPITSASVLFTRGFASLAYYWNGVGALDTDSLTLRVIVWDEANQLWSRVRQSQLLHNERKIVPVLGQRMFIRIDAVGTAVGAVVIFAAGHGRN